MTGQSRRDATGSERTGGHELTVDARQLDEVTVLYPRGYINAHTARLFESELRGALARGHFRIVVNGSGLVYIASAGLGALMGSIEEIRSEGGDLRLSDLSESVRNIFEILGFHHLYRIFPTELEAIDSFRGERAGS